MSVVAGSTSYANESTQPRRRRRPSFLPYLLAIPILIYEGIFVLYPIYEGIKSSFYTQANLGTPPIWVGLKNYRRLIDDEFFWRSLKQTFLFMGGVIAASNSFRVDLRGGAQPGILWTFGSTRHYHVAMGIS